MKSQKQHERDQMERADPMALATARELALLIPNDAVMLFGSRARGDHRPDSDMDILLLTDTAQEGVHQPHIEEAGEQAAAKVYGENPHPEVQVVAMLPDTYQNTKHSRNFLAGHIAIDMVLAEGDALRVGSEIPETSAAGTHLRPEKRSGSTEGNHRTERMASKIPGGRGTTWC